MHLVGDATSSHGNAAGSGADEELTFEPRRRPHWFGVGQPGVWMLTFLDQHGLLVSNRSSQVVAADLLRSRVSNENAGSNCRRHEHCDFKTSRVDQSLKRPAVV
jgi:hypothetical protein